ncbi:MAG: hypothetical protein LBS59_09090 [Puniceicoccales bacterium]|nr:hypothetical protein [Puniceicoccales bacterium]
MKKLFFALSALVIAIAIGVVIAFPKHKLLNTTGIPASVKTIVFIDSGAALKSKLAEEFPVVKSSWISHIETSVPGVDAKKLNSVTFIQGGENEDSVIFRGKFSEEKFSEIKENAKIKNEITKIGNRIFWKNRWKGNDLESTKNGLIKNDILLVVRENEGRGGKPDKFIGECIKALEKKTEAYVAPKALKFLSEEIGQPLLLAHIEAVFLKNIFSIFADGGVPIRRSLDTMPPPSSFLILALGEDRANIKFRAQLEFSTEDDAKRLETNFRQFSLSQQVTLTDPKLKALISATAVTAEGKLLLAKVDYPVNSLAELIREYKLFRK